MDASEGLTAVCSAAGVGRSMRREQGSAPGTREPRQYPASTGEWEGVG